MTQHLSILIALATIVACSPSKTIEGNKETLPMHFKHVVVSYEEGHFRGWPANFGARNWGNEIQVGFDKGYHKDLGPTMYVPCKDRMESGLEQKSFLLGDERLLYSYQTDLSPC